MWRLGLDNLSLRRGLLFIFRVRGSGRRWRCRRDECECGCLGEWRVRREEIRGWEFGEGVFIEE